MLELIGVSRLIPKGKKEPVSVLDQVSFAVPAGHLMALIGATGSGKSTLLKILAGIDSATSGAVLFRGRDAGKQGIHPNLIGYVPVGDDTLDRLLTVRESIMSALMLRVAGQTRDQRVSKASHLLTGVGLELVASQRVSTLTLPQRRRLKLALALVSDPAIVLCDEFTEGLDVKSERELAALLKFTAADHPGRIVIHATQSLGNLSVCDTAVILHEGRVCFHGPSRAITHYFSIPTIEELYPRLAKRPAQRWSDSWMRHRDSYYDAFKLGGGAEGLKAASDDEEGADSQRITLPRPEAEREQPAVMPEAQAVPSLPSMAQQARHLMRRRWTRFRRDRREWVGHTVALIAAPSVAAALILPNLHYLRELASGASQAVYPAAYTCSMAILVQMLVALMFGIRNGARELARDRGIFQRERAGGLRCGSWLISRLGFVLPLAILQSFTLGLFLELTTGGLPGDALSRLILLMLTTMAFSALSLGISACSSTPDRAVSRAWGLGFLNLILGGALLGFPRALGGILQPFITLYYGWSGSVETLNGTAVFEPITLFVRTWFASPTAAMVGLTIHFAAGVGLAVLGLRRGQETR